MTPEQTKHMNRAVKGFSKRSLAKYPKGQAENKDNLWEKDNLIEAADEEVVDQMFYLDALKTKRSDIAEELRLLSVDLRSDDPPSNGYVAGRIHDISIRLQRL